MKTNWTGFYVEDELGGTFSSFEMLCWQPIETAPKDGSTILAYHPDGYFITITWEGPVLKWACSAHGDTCGMYGFTHWIPLPIAPELGKKDE